MIEARQLFLLDVFSYAAAKKELFLCGQVGAEGEQKEQENPCKNPPSLCFGMERLFTEACHVAYL